MKQVYAAMAQVFDQLTYLQKIKPTTGISYAYVTESDVKRAIHRAYQRAGLLFIPREVERSTVPHVKGKEGAGERSGYITTVVLEIETVHVESGEKVVQVASGQGYDSNDKGVGKAWTYAFKNWALTTFCVESGLDSEVDDDDESLNKDVIEQSFGRLLKDLKGCEPKKGEALAKYAAVLEVYKTHSGRPVQDPREFATRADSLRAFEALKKVLTIWQEQRFEAEATKGGKKNAKANEQLEITDDDLPPVLRGEPSDADLDRAFAEDQ